MHTPILEFDITKNYDDFSLDCQATLSSGITAIFGPSGSGKTSLLNSIAGLLNPDEGRIELLGDVVYSSSNATNLPPEKRGLGYVFQDSALFPHMNVRDNIFYGYNLIPVHKRGTNLNELIDLFQISGMLNRGVSELSGGERQRVALVRALATNPCLLLLDEPLASLDAVFKGIILRYLKQIWSELGTPMIYVSHSLSEVMAIAQDMVLLKDGRVVVHGPPSLAIVQDELGSIMKYVPIENILEARVTQHSIKDGLVELKVGDICLWVSCDGLISGDIITVSIGAEDILIALEPPSRISARNVFPGIVEGIYTVGSKVMVYVDVGERIIVEITTDALAELDVSVGLQVYLVLKSSSILVLDTPRMATSSVI